MHYDRYRINSNLAAIFAIVAFLLISSVAVIWANGLRYNRKNHKFEQTAVLAIDEKLQNVSVKVNGEQVATETPWQGRNLNAGQYQVVVEKTGFFPYEKNFSLSPGQVGLVSGFTLIANPPKNSPQDVRVELLEPAAFDSQLTVVDGELLDRGVLITRFGRSPVQVHRLNEDYLYQQDHQLRLFVPDSNQDFLLLALDSDAVVQLKTFPGAWQVMIKNGASVSLMELTKPSVASPESGQ